MSKGIDEIRRLFAQRLKEVSDHTLYGEIETVDEVARTCNVRVGGIVYEGVLIYAIENSRLKGLVLIPAKGSKVLVSRIAGSARLYVSMFSVIDKILITIGDNQSVELSADLVEVVIDRSTLRLTPQGITVCRGESGLKKTLSDLCDAIGRLTVTTATGPSGTPINVAEFKQIQNELSQYLE